MNTEQEVGSRLIQQGVLPLYYHNEESTCIKIATAIYNAGIRSIEFTNRGPNALKNFVALLKERDANLPGLLLGTGTIKTAEDARQFIGVGADFLVSPVFDNGVNDESYLNKIFWIPGCTTPTEVHVAEQAGCKLVKLFPGDLLKPSYIKSLRPLFPDMKFMVTGGVKTSEGNLKKWFGAGATIVGLGSNLISKELLENNDFEGLENQVRQLLGIVNMARL